MDISFLLCTSSRKKPTSAKKTREAEGDWKLVEPTLKVNDKKILTGSQDKSFYTFSLGQVEMRRRNRTDQPEIAGVKTDVTSLPLKVSTATQTNECQGMMDGCLAMKDGYHVKTDACHDMPDACHAIYDGCHAMYDGWRNRTSLSSVDFPGVHNSLDRSSSSSCSCPECLLSLPTSDLGLEDAADCDLFVFEDDFERLSEAEYQQVDDDGVGDADQFIDFCFEETSRYLEEISASKGLAPIFSPAAPGKGIAISCGKSVRQDSCSVDMALIEETGSNHNDSGFGRTTDESVKADDSSEQEMLENYFPPKRFHRSSDGNLSSSALGVFPSETMMLLKDVDANRKGSSSFCQDMGELNQDFEQMHLQCLATTQAQPNHRRSTILGQTENQQSGPFFPSPKQRIVPRMGTRRDFCRHGTTAVMPQEPFPPLPLPESLGNDDEVIWVRNTDVQTNPEMNNFIKTIAATYQLPSVRSSDGLRGSDSNDLTSAYNTGNSCCNTPLLPQKVMTPPSSEQIRPLPDGQPLSTPARKTRSSEVDPGAPPNSTNMASQTVDCNQTPETVPEACHLRSLQKLYTQYVDVMYTNPANLEHTIMVQQKLFSQQIQLNSRKRDKDTELKSSEVQQTNHLIPVPPPTERCCSEDHTPIPMEWVVKRRSDGSRYIARRPLRNQILKDRAQRLTQERSGVTTDDDAASEMKLGRYWSRDKRKVHLERARFHRQQKEQLQRQKMETVRENDDQPNIIELSRRKVMRHKSKRLLDGFTTVQELLAHGNAEPFGRSSNPLLSVTTV